MTYRVTKRARQDLLNIWRYIAADDESAADRFIDLLIHHFRLLGDNPRAGRRRNELRRDCRSFPVGEYLILYRIKQPGVQILHIMHARRDIEGFFG